MPLRQVDAAVADAPREARPGVVVDVRVVDLREALAQPLAVAVVAQLVARHGEDATVGREPPVAEGAQERGHQLAPGEIAGAAEEDEVEGHRFGSPQAHSRRSSPAVEPSSPLVSSDARRGSRSLASALPSSTPHWSKLLMPHTAPLVNTRCS